MGDSMIGKDSMKQRKIIDLTLPVISGGSAPPKMPSPEFVPVRTMQKDGCRTTMVTLYNHAGTHVDSPSHFIDTGDTVDKLDLEQCMGIAHVIDASMCKAGQRIGVENLGNLVEIIKPGDRILFYTGWERYYPEQTYYCNFPALSLELAHWLVKKKVSLVGIDTGSVAALGDWEELTAVHKVFLTSGVILVEGLSNLDKLPFDQPFEIICLPLKLAQSDGAPARVVAIVET